MDALSCTPKYGFFSFPGEIRRMIYSHPIPDEVRIYPHDYGRLRFVVPWNLVSVSRQIREEIRFEISSRVTARVSTCMFLYNRVNDRDAYEKDMLSRNIYLGPSLRHLVINGVFEIKWKPDGDKIFDAPVWNQGIKSDRPALSPLYEPCPDYDCSGSVWYCPDIKTAAERIENWQLLWRVPPKQRAPRMYDIREVVDDIDQQFQTGKRGNMAPGLRKMDIVRLVAAFQVL
ncbi:MAG: hypothetical protein Q9169_008608, partial [Polycauliona sp. 2 TL-2023]